MGELVGAVRRGTEPPPIPGSIAHQRYLEIPVLYGTDRAAAPAREPGKGDWFGGERGEPSYGVVRVSVPDDHRMAALEKPRWWRLQFRPDPTKHVVALGLEPLAQPEFRTRATDALDRPPRAGKR